MSLSEPVFTFPTAGLTLTASELILRSVAEEPEIVKKVADICRWWLQSNTPLEVTTSGSTGQPKKLSFSRDAVKSSIERTAKALNLSEGKSALLALDTAFVGGRMMVLRALEKRMNLICVPPSSNPLMAIEPWAKVDFAAFVPLQAEAILNDPKTAERFKNISTVIIGGAALNPSLRKKIESVPNHTYVTFGMTETLSHVALMRLLPNITYYTLLPEISIGQDERGCLVIFSDQPDQSPVITNDLIERIDEDKFRWLGRIDNVINSGGLKFFPETLEIKSHEAIQMLLKEGDFIFTSLPDERLGHKIILLVFNCPKPSLEDGQRIREALNNSLDQYEMPREILWSASEIKNAGHKIDRGLTLKASIKIWP